MGVWVLALLMTALCCAALYYAAARAPVNAAAGEAGGAVAVYRAQLDELERDVAAGTLSGPDAELARAELGRELLRRRNEEAGADAEPADRRLTYLAVPVVAVVALLTYWSLGRPDLPALPAAERPEIAARTQLNQAIAEVEARLRADPADVRGWEVIAPVYMRLGRYADAVDAFRRVLDLAGPSADRRTDLAEALAAANGGEATGEALALLNAAADSDPSHARSRYYLAGEATRSGRFEEARDLWTMVIGMSPEDAPWVPVARQALAFVENALAGGVGPSGEDVAAAAGMSDEERAAMIAGMVEGLATRLAEEGGTAEEWARLVNARAVQGDRVQAQADLEAALAAIDDGDGRAALIALAGELGLDAGAAP
jgi:cytochrome c-type biogenesis protein CcmH